MCAAWDAWGWIHEHIGKPYGKLVVVFGFLLGIGGSIAVGSNTALQSLWYGIGGIVTGLGILSNPFMTFRGRVRYNENAGRREHTPQVAGPVVMTLCGLSLVALGLGFVLFRPL